MIAKRIGHSSLAFTADVYGHLLQDGDQDAARRLDGWGAASETPKP